jgi:hypothetical protein
MFFMDNETKLAKNPVSIRRRLAPWVGGVVLGSTLTVFGQIYYKLEIVGGYTFHALQFIERDFVKPHPRYKVYINDEPALPGIVVDVPGGAFGQIWFSGPVYSTAARAVYRLVPASSDPRFRGYRFEIERVRGPCYAVFEIRGAEPHFIRCADRDFVSD